MQPAWCVACKTLEWLQALFHLVRDGAHISCPCVLLATVVRNRVRTNAIYCGCCMCCAVFAWLGCRLYTTVAAACAVSDSGQAGCAGWQRCCTWQSACIYCAFSWVAAHCQHGRAQARVVQQIAGFGRTLAAHLLRACMCLSRCGLQIRICWLLPGGL